MHGIDWNAAPLSILLRFLRLLFPLCDEQERVCILDSVMGHITALCKSVDVETVTTCSVDTTVLHVADTVFALVRLVLHDFCMDVQQLCAIPTISTVLLLNLHHSLLLHDASLADSIASSLRSFPSVDSLYYSLFLLRWSSGSCEFDDPNDPNKPNKSSGSSTASLELRVASLLVKPTTLSSIQTVLCSTTIHRSLLTPFLGDPSFILSVEAVSDNPLIQRFLSPFCKDQSTRSYELQSELGHVTLMLDGNSVQCCPAQAILLLLFSERECVSMDELISKSPYQPSTTKRIVDSLFCCTCKGDRVVLPTLKKDLVLPSLLVLPLHVIQNEKQGERLLSKQEVYQTWIMKQMKQKKRISFEAVIKYVEKNVQEADRGEIRTAIEDLIQREYMERDEANDVILKLSRCACLFATMICRGSVILFLSCANETEVCNLELTRHFIE